LSFAWVFVFAAAAEVPETGEKEEGDEEIPYLEEANTILGKAGLPGIPIDAEEIQVYAWRSTTAGVFARFLLEPEDARAYLERMPAGVGRASPIPQLYLVTPPRQASWFQPGSLENGVCFFRQGSQGGVPEVYRLYADPETGQFYIAYRWNML